MANLMDGRCRCPEFQVNPDNAEDPCPVPGHPEGNKRPTKEGR